MATAGLPWIQARRNPSVRFVQEEGTDRILEQDNEWGSCGFFFCCHGITEIEREREEEDLVQSMHFSKSNCRTDAAF